VITTVTRAVEDFHEVDADGSYDLILHVDADTRVVITTDDNMLSEVQTFVQDGKLFIEMSDDYFNYKYTKLEVHVYAPAYSNVDLDGSVNTTVQDTIFSPSLTWNHEGSGNNSVKFSGNTISIKMSGSGDVQATGTAGTSAVTINGSGKIDALDLVTQNCDARIEGSGDVYVNCQQHLDARIDGSGDIRYIGSPTISTHISGSGSVSTY